MLKHENILLLYYVLRIKEIITKLFCWYESKREVVEIK